MMYIVLLEHLVGNDLGVAVAMTSGDVANWRHEGYI
jgi:hypothetical protein